MTQLSRGDAYDCVFHHLFQESKNPLELAQGFSAAWAGLSSAIPKTGHWDMRRSTEEKV